MVQVVDAFTIFLVLLAVLALALAFAVLAKLLE